LSLGEDEHLAFLEGGCSLDGDVSTVEEGDRRLSTFIELLEFALE
jgi:hypothetical protein